ncbi:MAG: chemotaxis protein CheC [Thermodesulfovibrionales bacterium]
MKLTPETTDALRELINIGVGRAAGVLSEMLNCRIILQVPFIKVLQQHELISEMDGQFGRNRVSAVRLGFKGSFAGMAALVFPPDSAVKLVNVLTSEGPDTDDLDAVRVGTLSEVGNIVINGVMGSISNVLSQHINYSLPAYMEDVIGNLLLADAQDRASTVLVAHTRFLVQDMQIEGDIILIFETGSFDALIHAIDKHS